MELLVNGSNFLPTSRVLFMERGSGERGLSHGYWSDLPSLCLLYMYDTFTKCSSHVVYPTVITGFTRVYYTFIACLSHVYSQGKK